jgi:hypothetical protein
VSKLTDGLVPPKPDPALADMDTTREQQTATPPPEDGLVTMHVNVGVAVSSGEPTPGVVHVPPQEAADLHYMRLAVYGDQPPRGYADGGQPGGAMALPRTFSRNLPATPKGGLR